MRTRLFSAFIILMLLVGYAQLQYDTRIDYFSERDTFVGIPKGKTLRILSFGYQNLVADMLFIWSIQFYSSYYLSNRYDYIEHIYNVITDLTPQYEAPYMVGAWIMALEKNDIPMAIRLLEKGSRNMPDEYIFDYEAGFYANQNLKDYELAQYYFERAAKRPNAPELIKRSRAHMVYMQDNLEYAWELWMEIKNKAKTLIERDAAYNHLYQIKFEMDKRALEAAIDKYKKRYKMPPGDLEALVRVGLIRRVPTDYNGNPYVYNPAKATVSARKQFRWKKS